MRTLKHKARATLLAVLAAAALALPASAFACGDIGAAAANYRPDGRIRFEKLVVGGDATYTYSKPWIGDDIYNETGFNQTARKRQWHPSAPGPDSWYRFVFGVSIQNDGASADQFLVHATGVELEGWDVEYFDGKTNITADVVEGSFTTPALVPGEKYLIEAKVTAPLSEDTLRRLVSLTSIGNGEKSDAVKLVVKFRACGC